MRLARLASSSKIVGEDSVYRNQDQRSTIINAFVMEISVYLLYVTTLLGIVTSDKCAVECSCKWKSGKRTVECINRALTSIPEWVDPETQVLDTSGNDIRTLPSNIFVRVRLTNLQRLYLRECHIDRIDSEALAGLTNLVELDLSHNLLTVVPTASFLDTPFLRDLVLSNNPLKKVHSHAFKSTPNLVKLDLSHTQLAEIEAKGFRGLELLESQHRTARQPLDLRLPLTRDENVVGEAQSADPSGTPLPWPETVIESNVYRLGYRRFRLSTDPFDSQPLRRGDHRRECQYRVQGERDTTGQSEVVLERTSIENAQEADSSEFYCVAENRAGSVEANFTLHVSLRTAGMSTLGSGQIAGISAALVVLILFILLIILVLFIRLRRMPLKDVKSAVPAEGVSADSTAFEGSLGRSGAYGRTISAGCKANKSLAERSSGFATGLGVETCPRLDA